MLHISHCLFLFWKGTVMAVLRKKEGMEVMTFRGEQKIASDASYWENWKDYAGFCKGNLTDFCLVYDREPSVPENLAEAQCAPQDTIWYPTRIQEALELCGTLKYEYVEIQNEKGESLFRMGSKAYNKSRERTVLAARYPQAAQKVAGADADPGRQTPLVRHLVEEARKIRESYEQ